MTELYKQAGVDIDAGVQAVNLMKQAIQATYTPSVLADVGSFGGVFALDKLPAQPVLVASIDGVGTKVRLAAELGRWRGVGHDLVNHCVNDILVQNARPLFFLDYVATSRLDTAEMPGVYTEGAFDLAGAVVGLASRTTLLPRPDTMEVDDVLIGLASSGPHTNGFSLIRRIVAERDLTMILADGQSLADALLAPHRCYLSQIEAVQQAGHPIKGMAHITGGGLVENVPRVLPEHLSARIVVRSWERPPLFEHLVRWSGMDLIEAHRVFNMGIGMVVIVPNMAAASILDLLDDAVVIGRLVERKEASEVVQLIL
jgi:phosphoribosylaminoimidazole (AIR) synthetase